MDFNVDLVIQSFPLLLLGAGITIKITALSVAVGIVIGLFMLFRHQERWSEIALDSVGRGDVWRYACRNMKMCGLK